MKPKSMLSRAVQRGLIVAAGAWSLAACGGSGDTAGDDRKPGQRDFVSSPPPGGGPAVGGATGSSSTGATGSGTTSSSTTGGAGMPPRGESGSGAPRKVEET